ncbi:MAG: succinate dehydrogenase, cytochrome b556 subunit [Cellulomonadaceae bacterium]|nr:succinate dehydrogenase, cytochrome b556 subunit [Cellulomonadaceae bacterium]
MDFPAAQAARFTQGRGLKRGSLYRGAVGQWVWVAHRISGVAIFLFLFVHILDTAVIRISPAAYNQIIGMYHAPIMALGELVLVAAVTFHALNGVRIILIDYWSRGAEFQQHMLYILIGVFVILMSVFAFIHLGNTLFHQGALL